MNSWSPGTETKTGEANLQEITSQIVVVTVTKNRNEMKLTIVLIEDSGTPLLHSLKIKNLKSAGG
jgi:hypothetical protein